MSEKPLKWRQMASVINVARFKTGVPDYSNTENPVLRTEPLPAQSRKSFSKLTAEEKKEQSSRRSWHLVDDTKKLALTGNPIATNHSNYAVLIEQDSSYSLVAAGPWISFTRDIQYPVMELDNVEKESARRSTQAIENWIVQRFQGKEKAGRPGGDEEEDIEWDDETEITDKPQKLEKLMEKEGVSLVNMPKADVDFGDQQNAFSDDEADSVGEASEAEDKPKWMEKYKGGDDDGADEDDEDDEAEGDGRKKLGEYGKNISSILKKKPGEGEQEQDGKGKKRKAEASPEKAAKKPRGSVDGASAEKVRSTIVSILGTGHMEPKQLQKRLKTLFPLEDMKMIVKSVLEETVAFNKSTRKVHLKKDIMLKNAAE